MTMAPLTEVAVGAESIPSLGWAVLRMVGAIALLAAGAWVLLRWRKRAGQGRRSLRVLDRAFLTRGASLALVSVAGKRLLLGISTDGVRLITHLDPGAGGEGADDFDVVLREVTSDEDATR
jgi:flagellar biogenesis protein FliO